MKRNDYYLGLFFIAFILCIGLMDIRYTTIIDYLTVPLFADSLDLLYIFSLISLFGIIYNLIKIISHRKRKD